MKRKGLGTFLMQIAELIAWKFNFEKVALTVFKNNTEALKFYKEKLKYSVDDTDPSDEVEDPSEIGYEILSKSRKAPVKEEKGIPIPPVLPRST